MSYLRSFARNLTPAPIRRFVRSAFLRNQDPFHPHSIVKTIGGESFPFFLGDATANAWYAPDKDPVTTELVFMRDRMLLRDDLVFDVGSHHGLHVAFLGRKCTRMVAIEPNPHNVAILRKNIALSGLQSVPVCQAAVGSTRGRVTLPQDSGDGGIILGKDSHAPTFEVDLLPLDELARRYGMPDLLKIDVEGFEAQVLKGAREVLRRRPKIAIEVHVEWVRRYGSSIDEVLALLNLESYQVWVFPYDPKIEEVRPWAGEDMNGYPPPKFTLFLLPKLSKS